MLATLARLWSRTIGLPRGMVTRGYRVWLAGRENIELGDDIQLEGLPLIDIRNGARLYIGNNVTLTSRNREYHINLHSPVKLFADRDGAVIKIGENSASTGPASMRGNPLRSAGTA